MARKKLGQPEEPASQAVIDHVPPRADPSAPDIEKLTAAAQKPVVPWAREGALQIEFHPNMLEIAKMKADSLQLLATNAKKDSNGNYSIDTQEGYDAIKRAYLDIVPLRTAADERRLEEGRQARDYVNLVNKLGNTVVNALHDIERPLRLAVQQADRRTENEAREKALEIERQQKEAEDARLAALKAKEDAERKAAEEELEKKRKIQEGEERRLKEERDKFELQKAEFKRQQREAQAKIDEALRAEEEAKAEVRRREESAAAEKRRLEELEAAKQRAAREALEAAEKKRKEDERLAKEKADRDAVAAAEKAAKAPDREKAKAYLQSLHAVHVPEMKSKEGKAVIFRAAEAMTAAIAALHQFANGR